MPRAGLFAPISELPNPQLQAGRLGGLVAALGHVRQEFGGYISKASRRPIRTLWVAPPSARERSYPSFASARIDAGGDVPRVNGCGKTAHGVTVQFNAVSRL